MVPLQSFVALGRLLTWLAAFGAVAVVARPVAAALFPRFHDRGAALSLPIGLALAGLVAYWVGQVRFGLLAPVVAALAVGAAGLAARRLVDEPGSLGDLREPAVVFLLAFGLLFSVRSMDPGIVPAGGEKFLDSALLYSLVRTESLPPIDPWFAGRPVRYYYGGHMLAALLARLTATAPRYAYNLALVGFYATLVAAAYGLAGALAAAAGRSPRIAGAFGAFLVGLAGNLASAARLLLGASFRSGVVSRETAARYGRALVVGIRAPVDEALARTDPAAMSFWDARYVVEGTLTPFPLWAYVNGDLNAYMISTPFLVLAAALCFAYWRTPAGDRRRRHLLLFGVLPAVGGLIAFVNTWSLPSVVGLAGLTLALAPADPADLLPARVRAPLGAPQPDSDRGWLAVEARRLGVALPLTGAVGLGCVAWTAPFLLLRTAENGGVGLLPPRSRFWPLVLVHGLFLVPAALYLFPRAWRPLRARVGRSRARALVLGGGLLAAVAALVDLAAVALVGPVLLVGWPLLRRREVGFETLLLIAAAGIVLGVEFVFARAVSTTQPRWNTVFKAYMQVWVLFGVGTGAVLARLLAKWSPPVSTPSLAETTADGGVRRGSRAVGRAAAALLVAGCLVLSLTPAVYGVGQPLSAGIGDPSRADPTVDGLRAAERFHPDEARAIAWLRERDGRPVIVAEPGDRAGETYRWVNAPSSLTGLPTLAGWKHEAGYRGSEPYRERVRAVRAVYEGPWSGARRVLVRHDVSYVYVGPNERDEYDVRDFAAQPGVEVAYRNPTVTVYDVTGLIDATDGGAGDTAQALDPPGSPPPFVDPAGARPAAVAGPP